MHLAKTIISVEEITKLIEREPLNLAFWKVLEGLTGASDALSKKSLALIIESIQAFNTSKNRPSFGLRQILFRLARSYNSPSLLRHAGLILQKEFNITHGQSLIEHADQLEGKPISTVERKESSGNASLGVVPNRVRGEIAKITFRKSGRCQLLRSNEAQKVVQQKAEAFDRRLTIPVDSETCMEQALQAMKERKTGTAFRLLSSLDGNAVSIDLLWAAWTDLGEIYYDLCLFQNAEECYRTALVLCPDLLISHFNYGTSLQMLGKEDQALEAYYRADSITPDHPKVWCNIGTVYFLQGDFLESENALRRSLNAKPDYARAWDNLACALGAQGRLTEAYWACCQALASKPNFKEAQLKMAILYCHQERWAEALPLLLESISHPSLHGYAYAYLSMTFAMIGNLLGAKQAISAAVGVDNEVLAASWSTLGQAYMDHDQFLESERAYQEAVRLNPQNGEHWIQLAMIIQRLGDRNKATQCFQKARELGARMADVA